MTHQQLKAVGDAWAEALAKDIDEVIARIDVMCAARRVAQADFDAVAFTHEARHACTLGMLGDASVRQRLMAAGIVS